MINRIQTGSEYQVDLHDLATIGKDKDGLVLSYKQGLQQKITIKDKEDNERQYREICANHFHYITKSGKKP